MSETPLKSIDEPSNKSWFINATDAAMAKTKNPIFGNVILIGALAGINELPLNRVDFESVVSESMSAAKVQLNLTAYDMGIELVN